MADSVATHPFASSFLKARSSVAQHSDREERGYERSSFRFRQLAHRTSTTAPLSPAIPFSASSTHGHVMNAILRGMLLKSNGMRMTSTVANRSHAKRVHASYPPC